MDEYYYGFKYLRKKRRLWLTSFIIVGFVMYLLCIYGYYFIWKSFYNDVFVYFVSSALYYFSLFISYCGVNKEIYSLLFLNIVTIIASVAYTSDVLVDSTKSMGIYIGVGISILLSSIPMLIGVYWAYIEPTKKKYFYESD